MIIKQLPMYQFAWPFIEDHRCVADRLQRALDEFDGDMELAVRHVFFTRPPALLREHEARTPA